MMPLKVQLNGSKVQITSPEKMPVTFINGVKKRLAKGVVFINGEKHYIWGTTDVKIEFIPIKSLLSPYERYPLYASQNSVFVSSGTGASQPIYKISVANISAPVIASNLNIGRFPNVSDVELSDSKFVFYVSTNNSANPITAHTMNRCEIALATDNLTVTEAATYSGSNAGWNGVKVNAGWLINYSTDWYLGATKKYTSNKSAWNTLKKAPNGTSIIYAPQTSLAGVWRATPDSSSQIVNVPLSSALTGIIAEKDNKIAVTWDAFGTAGTGRDGGFALYAANGSEIHSYKGQTGNRRVMRLIGRIRQYYYVMDLPYSDNEADNKYYVRLFDKDTGILYETLELPPWYDGSTANVRYRWTNCKTNPHVSGTGYLLFTESYGNVIRIKGH